MNIKKYSKEIVRCMKNNFKNISIHGLRSIFYSRTKCEIYFWIVIFIIGVVYYLHLLNENVIEFNYQRVFRMIDTTAYPIFQVPFPAVTLCNFNFVYKPKIKKIEEILLKGGISQNVTSEFFQKLNLLNRPEYVDTSPYRRVHRVLDNAGYNTLKLMQELAQPCSNLLKYCTWAGVEVNCSKIFRETKADLGLCCSFNYETLSFQKTKNRNINQQPVDNDKHYYTGSGPLLGLYVYLDTEKAQTVSSFYNNTGIYAYVHDKSEYPTETNFFSLIQPGRELAMKITPTVTESEEELRNYKLQSRQCLFNDEGSTFWSKQYRFRNCIQQCKMKSVAKLCNCIPYFYPNLGFFNACTLLDVPCLKKNEHIFGEITIKTEDGTDEDKTVCDCLPECTYIKYTGKTEMVVYKNMTGIPEDNSAIRVYFQNSWCMKYKMIRQLETNSFIAIIGGIFSLCLGGSILSLVELLCSILKTCIASWKVVKEREKLPTTKYPQLYWNEIYKPPQKNIHHLNHLYYYDFVN